MHAFDPKALGTGFAPFLTEPRLPELGPGKPEAAKLKPLEALDLNQAFTPAKLVEISQARACLAGLWLRFDFLEESHRLSQELTMPEGSYWHGIMHRREGDFANASYWFRRVGDHPIFEALGTETAQLLSTQPACAGLDRLGAGKPWDPHRFVDMCKACVHGKLDADQALREIQRLEWEMLFAYCHRRATTG